MPDEIERKYLVCDETWRKNVRTRVVIAQAYLGDDPSLVVRVRLAGRRAWLTLKGRKIGETAPEFEMAIPPARAREMMQRLPVAGRVRKIRQHVRYRGWTWEVDEFLDENAGLIVAEIELKKESDRPPLPDWVGRDVTREPRYANANLARRPYSKWKRKAETD